MPSPSVVRGTSLILEAHYKDGTGTLADPTSPRISLYDPLNTVVINSATPVRISTGIYQYTFACPIDAATGNWTAEWQGTVNAQALIATEIFVVLPVSSVTPIFNGSYTYDLGTSVGLVRMYIDDRDISSVDSNLPLEQRSAIFTDEEIEAFLAQSGQDVMYASALGLITISGNRQLLVQSRRIGKTAVDYGDVRKNLQEQAKELVKMANATPADGIAEINWDDFTYRRILYNAQLRAS